MRTSRLYRRGETALSEHLRSAEGATKQSADCREQGSTYDGQASGDRPPARPCGGPTASGMELRLQPKTGGLALQTAVDLGSAGRSRSSREQVPASCTRVRHQTNRRETVEVLHWNQGSSQAHAAKRVSHSLTRSTVPERASEQVRCKKGSRWPQVQVAGDLQATVVTLNHARCKLLAGIARSTNNPRARFLVGLKPGQETMQNPGPRQRRAGVGVFVLYLVPSRGPGSVAGLVARRSPAYQSRLKQSGRGPNNP